MDNPKSPYSVASPRVFENKDDDDYDYDVPSLRTQIPRSSDTGRSFQEQMAAAAATTRKNRGGRKKRRRKSRKKKRKSRRKTRKKRRRKSRKKRKTRRRKGRGKYSSAFKKTMKRTKTFASKLSGLADKSKPQHASRITRQGFKQPKKSSLSKHVTFRPISPQSQPPLMQQPSEGLQVPVIQQPQPSSLAQQMQVMSINPPSPTSSEDELSSYQNP